MKFSVFALVPLAAALVPIATAFDNAQGGTFKLQSVGLNGYAFTNGSTSSVDKNVILLTNDPTQPNQVWSKFSPSGNGNDMVCHNVGTGQYLAVYRDPLPMRLITTENGPTTFGLTLVNKASGQYQINDIRNSSLCFEAGFDGNTGFIALNNCSAPVTVNQLWMFASPNAS